MQRKLGFPVANCSIKTPDSHIFTEIGAYEEDNEQHQRRQQLINFGHAQWGFNNWNWEVTKQELDFVDLTNGKYCAGVVAFVSVSVKSFEIHRENIGYATSNANTKGFAIYKSRKCAVTNALRETLLSFGGSVATELMELAESHRTEVPAPPPPAPRPPSPALENNQNLANRPAEPKNASNIATVNSINVANKNGKKEADSAQNMRCPHPAPVKNAPANAPRAQPPPRLAPPAPPARPASNVSFVLQPVVGGVGPPVYGAPRLAPPHHHLLPQRLFPNCYEYAGPWHVAYEPYDRHHGNVNLNFNIPPKNLVVNSRSGSVECKSACRPGAEGEPVQYAPPQGQGCWIKPTIFYDGFWTEQKVKKWVAEQVEKQFPEEPCYKTSPPGHGQDGSKS